MLNFDVPRAVVATGAPLNIVCFLDRCLESVYSSAAAKGSNLAGWFIESRWMPPPRELLVEAGLAAPDKDY